MKRMRLLALVGALMLVPVQQAWAGGLDGRDGGTPPFMPEDDEGSGSDNSDWYSDTRPDGESECIDLELGPQCANGFPAGETSPGPEDPGAEDPGPEDTGGEGPGDSGPDVTVEHCEPECEIIETDGGGIIVWFPEDTDDTGGNTGDSGALSGTGVEEQPRPKWFTRGVTSLQR